MGMNETFLSRAETSLRLLRETCQSNCSQDNINFEPHGSRSKDKEKSEIFMKVSERDDPLAKFEARWCSVIL